MARGRPKKASKKLNTMSEPEVPREEELTEAETTEESVEVGKSTAADLVAPEKGETFVYFIPIKNGSLVVDVDELRKDLVNVIQHKYVCHESGHEIHVSDKMPSLETDEAKKNGAILRMIY
jgi:hypothetical protein